MKKTKTITVVIILVILAIFAILVPAIYSTVHGTNGSENSTINVGVLIPMTGPAKYYGDQTRGGVDLALQELKQKFPNQKVNVIYQDSLFTPKGGIDAYTMIKSSKINSKIDAIISASSNVSNAVKPLAEKDGVVQMAVFAGSGIYSSPNDLSFRTGTRSEVEAKYVAEFMKKSGYKRIAIVYSSNFEGAVATKNSLIDEMKKLDLIPIIDEGYLPTDNDYRTTLIKLKEAKPDAIFVSSLAKDIGNFMGQAKVMNIDAQYLAIRTAEDPSLFGSNPKAVDGLVYTYPLDLSSSLYGIPNFVKNYKELNSTSPDAYSAEGYIAMNIIVEAYAKCGKNTDCVQKAITGLKDYDSVFGPLSFDINGDVNYGYFFKQVKGGKFEKMF